MFIEDPATGAKAAVNPDKRLKVEAIASTIEHHINHLTQEAYHVLFSQSPTANDDCIFYLRNDGETDMVIEEIMVSVSGACELFMKRNSKGTRNGAIKLTPVNAHFGSGKNAEGTFEKGADLAGRPATLVNGVEIERLVYLAATGSTEHNFPEDLIIPKNQTFTLWCNAAGVTVTARIAINYHNKETG